MSVETTTRYTNDWALYFDGCTLACARSVEEAEKVIREETGEDPADEVQLMRPSAKLDLGEEGEVPDMRTAAEWAAAIAKPEVCGGVDY